MSGFWLVLGIATVAGVAALAGGVLAAWRRPRTRVSSGVLGYASGVVIGAVTLELLPRAERLTSPWYTAAAVAAGIGIVYVFDLIVNRGRMAGPRADERAATDRFHAAHRPAGDEVTVVGGASALEAVMEGVTIGVAAAVQPALAVLLAISVTLDNFTDGLSVGILSAERSGPAGGRRAVRWCGVHGAGLFLAAVVGWLALRGLPPPVLGVLMATGGGAMLYVTLADLVPEAEERQYEQSSALAAGAGLITTLLLSGLL